MIVVCCVLIAVISVYQNKLFCAFISVMSIKIGYVSKLVLLILYKHIQYINRKSFFSNVVLVILQAMMLWYWLIFFKNLDTKQIID